MEEVFAIRVKQAANRAAADPGYKIEIVDLGFRITYFFKVGAKPYTQENYTTWRAVNFAIHNPLLMAMNDLKDSSEKFIRKQEAAKV